MTTVKKKRTPRNRYTLRLPADLEQAIREFAVTHRSSQTAVFETALRKHLDGALTDTALVLRRFDRLDRAIQVLARDVNIVSEVLATFVQFWMASTPEVAPAEKDTARRAVAGRYARFTEYVAAQLAGGHRLINDLATPLADRSELAEAAASDVAVPPSPTGRLP